MTVSKAEKLARELIALRLRFSDRDFEGAMSILSSGQLLELPLEGARRVKSLSRPKPNAKVRPTGQGRSEGAELAVQRLYEKVAGDETLEGFVRQFLDRQTLRTGSAIRAFAETLDLQLPRKLPSRIAILEHLVRQLLRLSHSERPPFVRQADELENGESSLQLWSDLIVKDRSV